MGKLYRVLALILGVVLTLFVVQNVAPVRVRFLAYAIDSLPLAAVILGSALVGAALAYALGLQGRVRRGLEGRRQGRRIRELEGRGSAVAQADPGAGPAAAPPPDR